LVFADEAAAASAAMPGSLPEFLKLVRRDRNRVRCELEGPTGPLVHWADGQPLVDLTISPPDLESLFEKYYGSEKGGE
jgi:hypothetical protein